MLLVALKLSLYDRIKFIVTICGVAFSVTLVLVQVGILSGLLGNAVVSIEHSSAEIWITSHATANIDFGHPFPDAYVQRVRSVPGVAAADNLIVFYGTIALPSGAEETILTYGVEHAAAWNLPWAVQEGNVDELHGGNTFFLDDSATTRFGKFAVGDRREMGAFRLRIAGRTQGAKSFTTVPVGFFDFALLQRIMPDLLANRTTYILVKLAPGADPAATKAALRRALPFNDVYTREEWSARTMSYWIESTGLGMNMAVTVFLGCLIGVVVVSQTLYASTLDHLKEFGTMKAIGSRDRDRFAIVGWQAVIAAVGGYVVGVGVSHVLGALLAAFLHLEVVLPVRLCAIVFVGTVLLCSAASLLSLRKIATLDPAVVFRG